MPNPTNEAEVENVLSAIRRLIAEGRPARPGGAPLEPLVLTPALRVAGPPMVLEESAPEAPWAEEPPGEEAPEAAGTLILVNALPPAAVSPVPLPPAPEDGSEAPEIRLDEAGEGTGAPEPEAIAAPTDPKPDDLLPPSPEPLASPEATPAAENAALAAPWPDEAALRALVAEAVREELRGELGERLTCNLRKLVRREVMQALAMQGAA